MHPVGFEPTPPERIELESTALDHSATDAGNLNTHTSESHEKNILHVLSQPTARFELATPCLRNRCTNHCAMLACMMLCIIFIP